MQKILRAIWPKRCKPCRRRHRSLRTKKRHLTLLEVIIAFAIIVMCLFPLMYPHMFMLKTQSELVNKTELDHAVNLLYGEVIVAMQKNDIPWSDLTGGRVHEVDEALLKRAGYAKKLPYKGNYSFHINKSKASDQDPRTVLLLDLIFAFKPIGNEEAKELTYRYKVTAVRDPGVEQHPEEEEE